MQDMERAQMQIAHCEYKLGNAEEEIFLAMRAAHDNGDKLQYEKLEKIQNAYLQCLSILYDIRVEIFSNCDNKTIM